MSQAKPQSIEEAELLRLWRCLEISSKQEVILAMLAMASAGAES